MKSSRSALPKQVAVPPSYDSFFSFPIRKSGYSGVATYTRHSAVIPLKAEEGLSGVLQPKPPLTAAERISELDNYPPNAENAYIEGDLDYADLDSDGRTVVLDLGLFVLINVYCPNDGNGTEERDKYKMDFHRLLETRVVGLIKEGREVMVVGDLNACAAIIDHCEGHLMVAKGLTEGLQGEEGFWGKDSRRWMRGFLVPEGEGRPGGFMIDIVRKLWPERKGMYTCVCCFLCCALGYQADLSDPRLEHEDLCTRFKLWCTDRLYSYHTQVASMGQSCGYPTSDQRKRPLSSLYRPIR